MRTGLIYRCGELDGLTTEGWQQLAALGVRTLFDLRRHEEVSTEGPARGVGTAVHRVPMWDDDSAGKALHQWPPASGRDIVAAYGEAKVASYEYLISTFAPGIGSIVRGLVGTDGLPAVLHCAAGKDRTGIVAAVVLRAIGVGEPDVVADYLASREGALASRRERYLPAIRAAGGDEEAFARIYGAHPEALKAALVLVERRWGSVEEYLTQAASVDGTTLADLRRRLVTHP